VQVRDVCDDTPHTLSGVHEGGRGVGKLDVVYSALDWTTLAGSFQRVLPRG
jgi:hypothetical protein